MTIRPVRRDDARAVNELLEQLGYPPDGQAATADRIQTWIEGSSGAAYVAEAGGGVLGVGTQLVAAAEAFAAARDITGG